MEPVLLSTILFIPKGEEDVLSICIFLSELPGIWDIDTNNVYLDQPLWNQWKDCKNDQRLQGKFFDTLRKVSNSLLR